MYANEDTRKHLLVRAKFFLTKHPASGQGHKNSVPRYFFELYPELKRACDLAMDLTDIFNRKVDTDTVRMMLVRWYDKADTMDIGKFRTVTDSFRNYYDTI